MPEAPKAFLFDIGNVLLRLKTQDFLSRIKAAHPQVDTDAFLQELRQPDSEHASYERGLISGEAFHAGLCGRWGLKWPYEEWLRQWNDYFIPNPPMDVLLAKLQGKARFFALSNTNAEHYAHVKRAYRLFDAFENVFGSYQFGLRKPEPEFFMQAAEKIGLAPAEILFIDDMAAYTEAASSLGFDTFHYHFNDLELKSYLKGKSLDLASWQQRPGHFGC